MSIDSISASSTATAKGTKIVSKTGSEMDKDAFLRILSAELSNQNPDDAKDSTQYISQLAQFSSLEQMSNLNTTMTFSGASALIGKTVVLSDLDSNGYQYYGVVRGVTKDNGTVKLNVQVNPNDSTSIKDFPYSDVQLVTG
ncbi:flagellar hook assembly protein FlgD [Candidatus Clostridium radicumherbarum]|jgi:Flagellar hook capping protein|uniref:Flagellar hook assembly protein FlgD n=1 Tax=Candidatus Clostridium radicumherbarum TaxID=3381662 RepID=A0ABW8TW34_9CLOT